MHSHRWPTAISHSLPRPCPEHEYRTASGRRPWSESVAPAPEVLWSRGFIGGCVDRDEPATPGRRPQRSGTCAAVLCCVENGLGPGRHQGRDNHVHDITRSRSTRPTRATFADERGSRNVPFADWPLTSPGVALSATFVLILVVALLCVTLLAVFGILWAAPHFEVGEDEDN
jgi:hypothetical protein